VIVGDELAVVVFRTAEGINCGDEWNVSAAVIAKSSGSVMILATS
jgi:hypothetical protein